MAPNATISMSIRDRLAKRAVKAAVEAARVPVSLPPTIPDETRPRTLPPISDDILFESAPSVIKEGPPICIIGAGAAGLYAALILQSLNINFEILEAHTSEDRIGGRLFTYRFNGKEGRDAPVGNAARYDYIDMGAMRFPHLGFHQRVFDLFKHIEIDNLLIEYKLSADNTISNFNGIGIVKSSADEFDTFKVSQSNGGFVPDSFLRPPDPLYNPNDGSYWIDKALGEYVQAFKDAAEGTDPDKIREAIDAAWKKVVQHDSLSTRSYMTRSNPTLESPSNDYPNYPDSVIEWLESMNSATGLYDEAFVESIIDAVDFGDWDVKRTVGYSRANAKMPYSWYCIDGGTDRIAMGMLNKLNEANRPKLGRTVTKIAPSADGNGMHVTYEGQNGAASTRSYSQVICTVPLGCLATIDTSECVLSYTQKTAIRSLNYDASTKVAMKFKTRWWQDPAIMKGNKTIIGGVSSTDLPIRTVVYPSYGLNVSSGGEAPGVMLASYVWAQDARRLGSMNDPSIKEICLRNLATLHNIPLSTLRDQYVDHFTTAWYSEPLARGAFALFGPGQFGSRDDKGFSLFASLKSPATSGRLHIAGEATSIHHAWVLGALNSAWRAIFNALAGEDELRQKLIDIWGTPDEEDEETLRALYKLGFTGMI